MKERIEKLFLKANGKNKDKVDYQTMACIIRKGIEQRNEKR